MDPIAFAMLHVVRADAVDVLHYERAVDGS
jgi:hypothetical protein